MKTEKEKLNSDQTSPDDSEFTVLDAIAVFVAALVGTVVSILMLIRLERKQIETPFVPGNVDREQKSRARPKPTVADDDRQIFNLRTFSYLVGALIGMIVFVLIAGALLSGFLVPGRSVIITPAPTLLPPQPRLESSSAEIFPSLHATQEAELNSYGWVDKQKGVVHIPIDRAIELIAQRNLPVVTGTPVAATPYAP